MFNIILALIIVLSFLLVLIIMVQNPKGGGLSSSFGGDTQQIGGVKKTTDFLDKTTWILASLILVLILFSNITLNSESDNFESELIQNQEQLDIEEILENTNDDPNTNE
ncbi:MAG: preprotein translocase subunit SecG [Flavobacteriaceae bacterium]|jgi:preprotein translocase subunit SecG|nr:preprotein translocase subunit SecG [Flavobacteriaceae bacterium]|tara:strand:- start:330 stop:656 length:327 start_codon:yes stop_codon:yes gene_type:complete